MALPEPVPGLVIRYSYLWHNESLRGHESGSKDRPCAVVLVTRKDEKTQVTVLPVTHSEPDDPSVAVEIPPATKKRLGLDHERSWIICADANQFFWPGADLQVIPQKKPPKYDYGVLPPSLFEQIKTKALFLAQGRQLKVARRTE